MNKFTFHVKMHGKGGSPVHVVHGEYDGSMPELAAELNENEFILIEQFVAPRGAIEHIGPTILNQRVIGKTRPFREGGREFD